ncbi:hypothetical protein D1872_215720 [compost metagenome]
MRETISQAAPVRKGGPVRREPVEKVGREPSGPFPDDGRPLRVLFLHQDGVKQPIEVNGERDVIIAVPPGTVAVPTIPQIKRIDPVQTGLQLPFIVRESRFVKTQIHQHIKKQPVTVVTRMPVDLPEPFLQMRTFPLIQRPPNPFRNQRQRKPERRHFHQPLIIVGHLAPIFGMCGIRAVANPFEHNLPEVILPAAGEQRNQAPQHAGETLHFGDGGVESRPGDTKP